METLRSFFGEIISSNKINWMHGSLRIVQKIPLLVVADLNVSEIKINFLPRLSVIYSFCYLYSRKYSKMVTVCFFQNHVVLLKKKLNTCGIKVISVLFQCVYNLWIISTFRFKVIKSIYLWKYRKPFHLKTLSVCIIKYLFFIVLLKWGKCIEF